MGNITLILGDSWVYSIFLLKPLGSTQQNHYVNQLDVTLIRSASSSNLMEVLLAVKVDSPNLVPHDPFVVCSWSKLSLIFWSPYLCFTASYYSLPFQLGLTYTSLK